jgi:hypothetical protein
MSQKNSFGIPAFGPKFEIGTSRTVILYIILFPLTKDKRLIKVNKWVSLQNIIWWMSLIAWAKTLDYMLDYDNWMSVFMKTQLEYSVSQGQAVEMKQGLLCVSLDILLCFRPKLIRLSCDNSNFQSQLYATPMCSSVSPYWSHGSRL